MGDQGLSNIRSQKGYICLERVQKKDKREAGRERSTPRLSQQRPFRKGEFNPKETNTESHKIHQARKYMGRKSEGREVYEADGLLCNVTLQKEEVK